MRPPLIPGAGTWLIRIVPDARLAGSRMLFDLLLDGVRAGLFTGLEHALWDQAGTDGVARP